MSHYDFRPIICHDCGREEGQFYGDKEFDDGTLIVCIDCLMARQDEAAAEEEDEEEDEA